MQAVAGPSSAPPDNPNWLLKVWTGAIQWRHPDKPPGDNVSMACDILTDIDTSDDLEIEAWSDVLRLFLLPEGALDRIGRNFLEDPLSVMFQISPSPQLDELTEALESGMVGFIRLCTPGGFANCLVLTYNPDTDTYQGMVPNDQIGFIYGLEELVREEQTRLQDIVFRRRA